MGDRMYATEGDSGYAARLGSGWDADLRQDIRSSQNGRRGGDPWDAAPPSRPHADDAIAGVARRLQARLDRHLWLLDRLAEQRPEPMELPELLDTAARMRRDTESLLLLAGHEPGVRATGPRGLGELMADAAGLAEEPRRVEVRPAPAATIASAAAVEFLHVLAELVDHTTAAYPGACLELAGRIESGGATVDVLVDGAAWYDAEGVRRAAAAAEQLSQRSRYGIELHRPLGGPPPTGSGVIASVHCPAAVVTVEEPEPAEPTGPTEPPPSLGNGFPQYANGSGPLGISEPRGGGLTDFGADLGSPGYASAGFGAGLGPDDGWGNGLGSAAVNGNGIDLGNGSGTGHAPFDPPTPPPYSPPPPPPPQQSSQSSQVDELFGPLIDLPLEPLDDRYATPIFEAIASAWFRESDESGGDGNDPLDWETPQDNEWREAAARAARSEPTPTTATGLPRRRPGSQLVPPPRAQGGHLNSGPGERVPDRVRDRLSTYQRGLRQGRHRAPGEDGPEPEDW